MSAVAMRMSAENSTPIQLEPQFVERVWGTTQLAPYYANSEKKIGEVWFTKGQNFPLLIKFIFTSERLSVQVHPGDEYAGQHEGSRGKTEMWHILAAERDSTIALGFNRSLSAEALRQAILDGSVETLLNWVPVEAGETYFAEAGVVHAIGAGIVLCEIQQNSDVTYRLYDYGRGRELHVDKGLDVCQTGSYDGSRSMPVVCEHFHTELIEGPDWSQAGLLTCEHLLIAVAGSGKIGGQAVSPGQVWLVPADAGAAIEDTGGLRLLRVRCDSQNS
ncbi:MAG TPA: class I mannose-6-phosphate isomerase [Bryobacteraceae bacterium]|nr:class I mannose-6-phosphate isomerase [Bryobacteraceae bacterium]